MKEVTPPWSISTGPPLLAGSSCAHSFHADSQCADECAFARRVLFCRSRPSSPCSEDFQSRIVKAELPYLLSVMITAMRPLRCRPMIMLSTLLSVAFSPSSINRSGQVASLPQRDAQIRSGTSLEPRMNAFGCRTAVAISEQGSQLTLHSITTFKMNFRLRYAGYAPRLQKAKWHKVPSHDI
jgi:hypothetical protein